MSHKLYSIKDEGGEFCCELEHYKELLKDDNDNEFYDLVEWKPDIPGDGTFWCKVDEEAYESSKDHCGTLCGEYDPRNGISGRCRFHSATYSPTDKIVRIKK